MLPLDLVGGVTGQLKFLRRLTARLITATVGSSAKLPLEI
jgi:hypothetical protein